MNALDPYRNARNRLAEVVRDGRHALTSLWRGRRVSGAIVATGTLGIAAAITMFALTEPYVTRRLPYAGSDRLVTVRAKGPALLPGDLVPDVRQWIGRTELFDSAAAVRLLPPVVVHAADGPSSFQFAGVTSSFFEMFGLAAPDVDWSEGASSPAPVVLFPTAGRDPRSQFGGSGLMSVVGVLPPGFVFPGQEGMRPPDGLVPYEPGPVLRANWSSNGRRGPDESVRIVARLREGVTTETLVAALGPLPSGRSLTIEVVPLHREMMGRVRPFALVAMVAALLILIITAANVTNLWLARAAYGLRDTSIRRYLGASAFDLVRLSTMEALTLSSASLLLGVALATAMVQVASSALPPEYAVLGRPRITSLAVSMAILSSVAIAAVSLACSAGWYLNDKATLGSIAIGRWPKAIRSGLVAIQSCFAVMMAIGAGMLLQSFALLVTEDSGYDRGVLSAPTQYGFVAPGGSQVPDALARLRRIPGVVAAAGVRGSVVRNAISTRGVTIGGEQVIVDAAEVTDGYFDTVGMRILSGRGFLPDEQGGGGVVVDEAFVDYFWPGRNPLGMTLTMGGSQSEVIGVVNAVLRHGVSEGSRPTIYTRFDRQQFPVLSVVYVVRVDGAPEQYRQFIRRGLAEVAPKARIGDIDTIGARLADTIRDRVFVTVVVSSFTLAGIAVCLAGTISVVRFVVAARRRDLAIKIALGGPAARIVGTVAGESAVAAALGGAVGLGVGRWASTALNSMVFGLEAGNWATSSLAAVVVMATVLVAAWIPARNATAMDPMEALKGPAGSLW